MNSSDENKYLEDVGQQTFVEKVVEQFKNPLSGGISNISKFYENVRNEIQNRFKFPKDQNDEEKKETIARIDKVIAEINRRPKNEGIPWDTIKNYLNDQREIAIPTVHGFVVPKPQQMNNEEKIKTESPQHSVQTSSTQITNLESSVEKKNISDSTAPKNENVQEKIKENPQVTGLNSSLFKSDDGNEILGRIDDYELDKKFVDKEWSSQQQKEGLIKFLGGEDSYQAIQNKLNEEISEYRDQYKDKIAKFSDKNEELSEAKNSYTFLREKGTAQVKERFSAIKQCDKSNDIKRNKPGEATITMEELVGKENVGLWHSVFEEEQHSVNYREADLLNSTTSIDGSWNKDDAPICIVAGVSGGGKTKTSVDVVSKYVGGDKNKKSFLISADGGMGREVSQMRNFLIQIAEMKGYTGIKDLHSHSKAFENTKHQIREAVLTNKNVGLIIPETFSKWVKNPKAAKKLMKQFNKEGRNIIFAHVKGRTFDVFKKVVAFMGSRRAWKTKWPDKEEGPKKFDLNNKEKTLPESKKYGGLGFIFGWIGSKLAEMFFKEKCHNNPNNILIEVNNDLMICRLVQKKNENGIKTWVLKKAKQGQKGAELISKRLYDKIKKEVSYPVKTYEEAYANFNQYKSKLLEKDPSLKSFEMTPTVTSVSNKEKFSDEMRQRSETTPSNVSKEEIKQQGEKKQRSIPVNDRSIKMGLVREKSQTLDGVPKNTASLKEPVNKNFKTPSGFSKATPTDIQEQKNRIANKFNTSKIDTPENKFIKQECIFISAPSTQVSNSHSSPHYTLSSQPVTIEMIQNKVDNSFSVTTTGSGCKIENSDSKDKKVDFMLRSSSSLMTREMNHTNLVAALKTFKNLNHDAIPQINVSNLQESSKQKLEGALKEVYDDKNLTLNDVVLPKSKPAPEVIQTPSMKRG